MITRKLSIPSLLVLLLLLSLVAPSTQQITVAIVDPNSQCLGQPCLYKNECRDRFGTCGDSALFCNQLSQWSPGCGGAPTLERPSEEQQQQQTTTMTNGQQTNGQQTATVVGQPQPQQQQQQSVPNPQQQQQQQPPPPAPAPAAVETPAPTIKWELWTRPAANEQQSSSQSNNNGGGGVQHNNNNGNYTGPASNLTAGWFDGSQWSSERNEEDDEGGIIDKIDFWNNDDKDENDARKGGSSIGCCIIIWAVGVAWTLFL